MTLDPKALEAAVKALWRLKGDMYDRPSRKYMHAILKEDASYAIEAYLAALEKSKGVSNKHMSVVVSKKEENINMTDKTPHELGLMAAEKAYNLHIQHGAIKHAVDAYLSSLLNDVRVVEEMAKATIYNKNPLGRAPEVISTLKRIAGVV